MVVSSATCYAPLRADGQEIRTGPDRSATHASDERMNAAHDALSDNFKVLSAGPCPSPTASILQSSTLSDIVPIESNLHHSPFQPVDGLAKNERENVSARELEELKAYAADLLERSPTELETLLSSGALTEICRNG